MLKQIPKLRDLEEYTFENTCQILAMHFHVNIVIHELKYERDHIAFIQSPTKRDYDVSLPRVDLLAFRNRDLNEGHVDLISPRNSFYKKHRKWACVFCPKIIQTHWQSHMCTAKGLKNCKDCKRILMKKTWIIKYINQQRKCSVHQKFVQMSNINAKNALIFLNLWTAIKGTNQHLSA